MRRRSALVPVMVAVADLLRCKDSFIEDGTDMVGQYLAMHFAQDGRYQLFQQARLERDACS